MLLHPAKETTGCRSIRPTLLLPSPSSSPPPQTRSPSDQRVRAVEAWGGVTPSPVVCLPPWGFHTNGGGGLPPAEVAPLGGPGRGRCWLGLEGAGGCEVSRRCAGGCVAPVAIWLEVHQLPPARPRLFCARAGRPSTFLGFKRTIVFNTDMQSVSSPLRSGRGRWSPSACVKPFQGFHRCGVSCAWGTRSLG